MKDKVKFTFSLAFSPWGGRFNCHITRKGNLIRKILICLPWVGLGVYPSRGERGLIKAISDIITHEYTHLTINEIRGDGENNFNYEENIEQVLDELIGTKYTRKKGEQKRL